MIPDGTKKFSIFLGKSVLCLIAILLSILSIILMFSYEKNKYFLSETNGKHKILLIANDSISEQIKNDINWEPAVCKFLKNNVKKGNIVVEVGSYLGHETLLFADLVGPNGFVYSYEGNNEPYDLTSLSIKMNDFSSRVILKNLCVGAKNGSVDLLYETPDTKLLRFTNSGAAKIAVNSHDEGYKSLDSKRKIQLVSLDSDIPDFHNIDWLRMDIEGYEIMAIAGAEKIIKSSPNLKIIMKWSPEKMNKYENVSHLIDKLTGYGFQFYSLKNCGMLGEELSKIDLLKKYDNDIVLMRDKIL